MDNELISKKDLLELTGISYGQLYRWKRKNLIPEDWFIKKSTFTGQETFFEKDKILARIDKIKNMKDDDFSLDDMAEVFSPLLAEVLLSKKELIQKEIVSQMTLETYTNCHQGIETFSFDRILNIAILEKFLQTGSVGMEEGKIILQNLEDDYKNYSGKNCDVVFIRKFGIATCFLLSVPNEIHVEKTSKLVAKINVSSIIEELKSKIIG
jgi:DNA-binding transcriptional MerR regulator